MKKKLPATKMDELNIRKLRHTELKDGADLLSRGMRDNPNNVQAFGTDPEHRIRALARMFQPVLQRAHVKGHVLGTFRNGEMIGLYSMTPPGQCQLKVREKLRMVPAIFLGNSVTASMRVLNWFEEWSRHDPRAPHWHFGPFAVDAQVQGRGIGSMMLGTFCARMDGQRALAYLETDKSGNVRFYEKFGFVTISEALVLGTPNWFMQRQPARPDVAAENEKICQIGGTELKPHVNRGLREGRYHIVDRGRMTSYSYPTGRVRFADHSGLSAHGAANPGNHQSREA